MSRYLDVNTNAYSNYVFREIPEHEWLFSKRRISSACDSACKKSPVTRNAFRDDIQPEGGVESPRQSPRALRPTPFPEMVDVMFASEEVATTVKEIVELILNSEEFDPDKISRYEEQIVEDTMKRLVA